MKLLKYVLPLVAVCGLTASVAMAKNSDGSEINERDIQAVKQHLKTKRDMRLSDKHDDLNISGDIRFEYKHLEEETRDGSGGTKYQERGNNSGDGMGGDASSSTTTYFGENEFDVEFNLYFDYTAERTWAHVHLEFDNCAGITHSCDDDYDCGSGTCDEICLRSAYFGYNIFEEGTSRLDVEMGRWDMYAIFDSRVQFQHRYDGVLVTYSNSFEDIGDFYVKGGMFVIDSVASNWGYAAEVGLVDIMDVGLDIKYSYVDYKKKADRYGKTGNGSGAGGPSPCVRDWNARVSQISAAFHFNPEYINEDVKLYGAFLWNHAAKDEYNPTSSDQDMAWYLGVMIGGIQGEGDWAVDANYQHVEAQAVPGFAVSGIGTGNVNGKCYGAGSTVRVGNTNYSGFLVEAAYALTDNLVVVAEFEHSSEDSKSAGSMTAGGLHRDYTKYELEFMYAF